MLAIGARRLIFFAGAGGLVPEVVKVPEIMGWQGFC
jgi:hypothetical protein